MIKGIAGYGYLDELVIPIITNTPRESELAGSLAEAIHNYPKSCAVLVRDHGIYVWGDSWGAAKRHSECLHYLFSLSIQMHQMGKVSPSISPSSSTQLVCSCCSTSMAAVEDGKALKRKIGHALLPAPAPTGSVDVSGVKYVILDIEGETKHNFILKQ